jgi:lysyl-tRNA synthetase class I
MLGLMSLQARTLICLSCGGDMEPVTEREFKVPNVYEYRCTCGKAEIVDIAMLMATARRTAQ